MWSSSVIYSLRSAKTKLPFHMSTKHIFGAWGAELSPVTPLILQAILAQCGKGGSSGASRRNLFTSSRAAASRAFFDKADEPRYAIPIFCFLFTAIYTVMVDQQGPATHSTFYSCKQDASCWASSKRQHRCPRQRSGQPRLPAETRKSLDYPPPVRVHALLTCTTTPQNHFP